MFFFHALADFPLQGPFLSEAKNKYKPVPGFPYQIALLNHCIIQAGFVWLATGSMFFGILELVLHWIIDSEKNKGTISVKTDQQLHLWCKVFYAILFALEPSHGVAWWLMTL